MRHSRNLIIIVLSAVLIFQTGRLWYDGLPSGSFFTAQQKEEPLNLALAQTMLAKPFRIVTNFGNNRFAVDYCDTFTVEQQTAIDGVIKEMLRNPEFVGISEINWNELLKDKSLIYEYKFNMPSDVFAMCMDVSATYFTSRISEFNSIYLIPGDDSGTTRIFFLTGGNAAEFRLTGSKTQVLLREIGERAKTLGSAYYVSSKLENRSMFSGNCFLPSWSSVVYTYNHVNQTNPYSSDGSVLLNSVEKKIDVFFDNPAVKWISSPNGVFIFSDQYTFVKYYDDGLLEVNNSRVAEKNQDTLLTAYAAALSVTGQDDTLTNSFYLADYSLKDGTYTLCFDITVNNMPLFLSDKTSEKIALDHMFEVSVSNGAVLKYRRYVARFEVDKTSTSDITFGYANVLMFDPMINGMDWIIDSFDLAYIAESDMLSLYWRPVAAGRHYATYAQ